MKFLALALILTVNVATADIGGIVVESTNSNEQLGAVPKMLQAVLVNQGIEQKEIGKDIYAITLTDVKCDSRSRDAYYPGSSIAALPVIECFAKPNGKKEIQLQDSYYIDHLLSIVNTETEAGVTDCAMGGKCRITFSKILCVSNQNGFISEAFSCTFSN